MTATFPVPAALAVVFPLVLPLLGMGLALVTGRRPRLQRTIGLAAALGLVGSAILLAWMFTADGAFLVRMGGWDAPVGIPLGVDALTVLMLGLAGLMGLVTQIYAWDTRGQDSRDRAFVPLFMLTLLGVNGAFLARDLFNLYVWFEVLLMGGFGLLVVTGGRAGREAAVKSLTLNMMGSLLFLVAVGATYGLAGTLDMTLLQQSLSELYGERPAAVTGVGALLLVAFAVKAAVFPFHFWLPDSYHVPAAGVCALFAAMLTKVGVYSILRVFTLPFAAVEGLGWLLGVLAAVTMVGGVIGAIAQSEIKRILAWHSISQTGYMIAGLALLSAPEPKVRLAGVAAAIFFVVHHGLVKPALFLVAGWIEAQRGTSRLKALGGLYGSAPVLAVVFLLAALSLAGIPPLSGFWAKLAVVEAAVAAGRGWLVAAALGAGLVTLMSMVKIWNEAFWKPAPEGQEIPAGSLRRGGVLATVGLVVLITLIGLQPEPLLGWARAAADGVLTDLDRVRTMVEVAP